MTNTEKERLALLVGDKSITCAKLQQAFPEIYDAYLQLLSSNMTQDHCLLVPGHPLPPNREYFLHYQPDATFHLSDLGQDILERAREKKRLKRLDKIHLILEGIAAAGSLITIAAFLWQALH